MWALKRSGNTMMVSYATDPQMSALLFPGMPLLTQRIGTP
jgi:hypothetical protein